MCKWLHSMYTIEICLKSVFFPIMGRMIVVTLSIQSLINDPLTTISNDHFLENIEVIYLYYMYGDILVDSKLQQISQILADTK